MKRICLICLASILLISLISMSCDSVATPPAAPMGLTCKWVSSSQIDLSWDASSGATGYHIYRCAGASCTPTAMVHNQSTTSWSDIGLTSNTTYRYRLTAYNEAGESSYSSIVSCTTYNPEAVWNKTFGGSGDDWGVSVQQTSDGGYVIAGRTFSYGAGASDAWLLKTNSLGNMAWNQTFGGSGNDTANSVQQTSDGGYIITGQTDSYGAGGWDIWLLKTNSSGNMAWNQTFGGSGNDYGYSVQQTADGGYVIAGITNSCGAGGYDVWLIKIDPSGNETWNRTFGGSDYDSCNSVQQTSDGGYIIAGYTDSFGAGGWDVWLIKIDPSGNEAWNQTFGGSGEDWALSVQQTSDGGYIIAGTTVFSGAGGWDIWLIKADSSGSEIWNQTFDGLDDDYGASVQQTSDGGYVIVGTSNFHGAGKADVWLIRTDSSGSEIWNQTFDGLDDDYGASVQQTSDGGYIVLGDAESYGAGGWDVWLIKVTA